MYERYFGLNEPPFNLTSNPRYLLLTLAHAEALSTLRYGIASRKGIIVLVGEAGTGKTTVVRAAVAMQPRTGRFVLVNNPLLTRSEFFQHLVQEFGLSEQAAASKTSFLSELKASLEASLKGAVRTCLIVDEAHALPCELLEEIRLLANMETDDQKLLPVVLAGQPELGERLNEPGLRQLKQRVALRCALRPLQIKETAGYVAGRIRVAGGDAGTLFTQEAIVLIHRASRGLPRDISVICDNALLTAFAADERRVGPNTVLEVCRDLDIEIPESARDAHSPIAAAQPLPVDHEPATEPALSPGRVDGQSAQLPRQAVARSGMFGRLFSWSDRPHRGLFNEVR